MPRPSPGPIATIAALLLATRAAAAPLPAPHTLDFEQVTPGARVGDFYDAGPDGAGARGPAWGARFTGDLVTLIDADDGGTGDFAHEPTPGAVATLAGGARARLNVAFGFDDFSVYVAAAAPGIISFHALEDGAGALLGRLAWEDGVTPAPRCPGDPNGIFCDFRYRSISFAGIARSASIETGAGVALFDDLRFATTARVAQPPAAATLALGVAALVLRRPRR